MYRAVLLLAVLMLAGCSAFAPVTREQMPKIGWPAQQVITNLGQSEQRSSWASGFQSWRYGIDRLFGYARSYCHREDQCLTVFLQDGIVTEVHFGP